jgi:polyisoprenyl-phosphate glycosyltransferase
MTAGARRSLGIVVPVFNEERGLAAFHQQLSEAVRALPVTAQICYVNDGSTDETERALDALARADARVTVVTLTRNFGHQAALSAGLDVVAGDVVVTLDGDGQHPPELIPEMLKLYDAGYDVVLAQRSSARDATAGKRFTSGAFYWLLSRIGDTPMHPGVADYRLTSRAVVNALKNMPEYHRFLRGMVAWLGFKTVIIPYPERGRAAGTSKYSLRKMLRLASDAVSSFSLVPLRIGIALGLSFLLVAALEVGYVAWIWLRGETQLLVPGWSSLMFAILLVGGLVMILLGLVGSYVGYIFQEVKRRPVYVVRAPRGKEDPDSGPSAAGRRPS